MGVFQGLALFRVAAELAELKATLTGNPTVGWSGRFKANHGSGKSHLLR